MIKSGIYCISCLANGKKYIGQTSSTKGFDSRWYDHKRSLNKNKHFNKYLQRSWNKYGEVNFEFSILEECQDDMLNIRECAWINYHNTLNPDIGFNLKQGGSNGKLSQKSRDKISKSLMGHTPWNKGLVGYRTHSDATRLRMSNSQKNRDHSYKVGRVLSAETLKKISENSKRMWAKRKGVDS